MITISYNTLGILCNCVTESPFSSDQVHSSTNLRSLPHSQRLFWLQSPRTYWVQLVSIAVMKTHGTHCFLTLLVLSVGMKVVPACVCLCAVRMAAAGRDQKVSVRSPELECKLL